MIRLIPLILLALMLSGCGILDDIFSNESTIIDYEPLPDEPPALNLLLDVPVELDLGTYCWTSAEVGLCVDMMSPIYDSDNHIAVATESLELQFVSTPPTTVVAYLHPGSNLMTRIADIQLEATLNSDGTISIPLIEQLQGDYVLVVSAVWQGDSPTGDAMYTLPITVE